MLILLGNYWIQRDTSIQVRKMLLYIEMHTQTSMSHWELTEFANMIQYVKIFLNPEESTYYYCGLLGTNSIHQVTEIRLSQFW